MKTSLPPGIPVIDLAAMMVKADQISEETKKAVTAIAGMVSAQRDDDPERFATVASAMTADDDPEVLCRVIGLMTEIIASREYHDEMIGALMAKLMADDDNEVEETESDETR